MKHFLLWTSLILLPFVHPGAQEMADLRERLALNPYDQAVFAQFQKQIASVENVNERVHDLAIAYVGSLAHGDGERARSAYGHLKRMHPDSRFLEALAPERFQSNCKSCGQAGNTKELCRVCDGRNKCGTCKGRRKIQGLNDRKRCPTCQGTGRCTACNFRGASSQKCRNCGGVGRVLNTDRAFLIMKRMLAADRENVRAGKWERLWWNDGAGGEKKEKKAGQNPR